MKSPLYCGLRVDHRLLWALLLISPAACAQSGSVPITADSGPELTSRIEQLTKSLEQTQVELAQSRTEIQQLRATLQEVLDRMNNLAPAPGAATAHEEAAIAAPETSTTQAKPDEAHGTAQISQDDWDILNARVDEQRQTKVESGSRYRLKLSGVALFNAFANTGQVDNVDLPSIAAPKAVGYSEGSAGASIRQSLLGLTGIGPAIFGARSIADLQVDFFGGLPNGYGASNSGIAELRLARIRLDWKNTSVVSGLDYPFFSPNLPTTYMSVVVPGFASAGNLWTWTPTVRVEQRFSGAFSPFKAEAGFLDPASNSNYVRDDTTLRIPSPTQNSRQPTYAVRLSANTKSEDRPTSIGISGVYSPQRFLGGYRVTGWAGTLDWKFPLLPRTELSGQFFTGRGLDGFGGLPLSPLRPPNPVQYASVTAPVLANLGVIGGWSQFKVKLDTRNEFNVAAGTGGRNSSGLRNAAVWNSFLTSVPARNQMLFVNYIFRPRSDLLFSAEYRRLRTYEITAPADSAGQVGLAIGFLF
jgi:hypothetical protein